MIRALVAYLVARIRAIGHEHTYSSWRADDSGMVHIFDTAFCQICGRYR